MLGGPVGSGAGGSPGTSGPWAPAPRLASPLQEELENFPLPTVQHSQTVLNQLRYPSVLLLVCQDSEQSKPDVHFFHCDEVEVSARPRPQREATPTTRDVAPPLHPSPAHPAGPPLPGCPLYQRHLTASYHKPRPVPRPRPNGDAPPHYYQTAPPIP